MVTHRVRDLWLLALFVLWVGGVTGCMTTTQAIEFNNAIAEGNKKLSSSGQAWGKEVGPALKGEPANPEAIRRSHEQLRQALAEVKKTMDALTVPDDKSAREFRTAHKKFLEGQTELIEVQGAEMVTVAADTVLSPLSRATRLQKAFARMQLAEMRDLAAFKKAQDTFATTNRLTIKKDDAYQARHLVGTCACSNQWLNVAGQELGVALRPAFNGESLRQGQVTGVMEEFRSVVKEVREVVDAIEVPESECCRQLLEAEKGLLDVERSLCGTFDEIVRLALDAGMDRSTRRSQVQALLKKAVEQEQASLEKVKAGATKVASEHRLN